MTHRRDCHHDSQPQIGFHPMSNSHKNPHGLHVGQVVYYVPYERRHASRAGNVVVTKVGHKWAEISPVWAGRISLETLREDSGAYTSRGEIWLSEDAYKQKSSADSAWRRLRELLQGPRPNACTADNINSAAKALGLAWGE